MSVTVANVTPEKVQQLRQTGPPLSPVPQTYNLPALVDLALKTNPQTRRAWYAAQSANAQLGQAQASDYPTVAADADGGYLKLPIQFPGQTLLIRNEAFLPQIKVSYDLLRSGKDRMSQRRLLPSSPARARVSRPRWTRPLGRILSGALVLMVAPFSWNNPHPMPWTSPSKCWPG